MYCQVCGTEESQGACPRCGPPSPATAATVSTPTYLYQSVVGPRGVGGWLLFFCISLLLVGPVQQGRIAILAFKNLAISRYTHFPTLIRLASVGVIYSGLSIFSVIAGLRLWCEDVRGPSLAKSYLLVSTVIAIALNSILAIAGVHIDVFRIVLGRLAYGVVWYSYLQTSTRVKATFPGVR
ncbi:MAG TPA: DUF2569 family protein [Terriglobales bacterium]|nr:DUF2569 family protein [Terriglobales bacterium]